MFDDIFLHEDISKSENRINLAIFGLMCVKPFQEWLHQRLSLPASAVLYPCGNLPDGSGRPDFVVKDADTERTLAWIEVECGRDAEQLARFRRACPERVIAIWGRRSYGADLSLEEIAEHLSGLGNYPEPQIRYNSSHLRLQINEVLRGGWSAPSKPVVVSERMRQSTFVRQLEDVLGTRLNYEISGRMRPGEIRANTRAENGFSLRVYARAAAEKSLSILNQTGGRPDIYFQSRAKMLRYLPDHQVDTDRLVALVRSMGGDMTSIELTGKTSVPIAVAEQRVSELASIVVSVAE